MPDDLRPPFRIQFDNARDPYTARNALGIAPSVAGAPTNAQYITAAADPTLTAERVLTNTATITWDFSTPGQAKASAAGGGNVGNSGTPTLGQYAKWVTATTIQGVAPATVLSDIGAAPLASPTFTGDPKAPTPTAGDNDTSLATTAFVTAAVAASGPTLGPPQGRLTLQTATPVMTTTQAAKTTILYSPYIGNVVPIWDGTKMVMTTFTELSVATTDTTKSPAAIGANKCNDWYVWNDAGTIRLGHGPDWTNDTTRNAVAAIPQRLGGLWVNNLSITNGPSPFFGTYVGTTRSNASSQLDWIYGASAVGGGAAFLGVWNCYNRVNVATTVIESAASWSNVYGYRPLNASTNNRVSAVFGLSEDMINVVVNAGGTAGSTFWVGVNIGFNSTSTVLAGSVYSGAYSPAGYSPLISWFSGMASLGFNYWQALEYSTQAGGGVFIGSTESIRAGTQFSARM